MTTYSLYHRSKSEYGVISSRAKDLNPTIVKVHGGFSITFSQN